ncbi:MAG: class I SAM-dependent methyltransferase [Betaproteobacteria bacterium]|nr:class I SAM-dependent methyltransferase [Betaproteobacteria bacterium]
MGVKSMHRRLASLLCAAALSPCIAAQLTPTPVVEDVPFITTPDHVTVAMLELAGVGPKDHVIDLGSGDGRIVITAAKRFGASGLGVEIVPELVAQSRNHARRAGVEARTRFEVQDLFATDLAPATVVTMYLLPEVNLALRPRLLALAPGTRIVSHDWDLGDWAPDRTLTLPVPQKTIGLEKTSRLHLWTVPARVNGLWCGAGGTALRIEQRYQVLQATLDEGKERRSTSGRIDGTTLRMLGTAGMAWAATADGEVLRTAPTTGKPAGPTWRRSGGAACG